ncbi:MAG: PEP-CTERM sorting domain-containing protein [Burkholderiaceae bacterium]|nr:PEP-CTERM sorting domain-containing protein [Burkholderiaceae bacterium]
MLKPVACALVAGLLSAAGTGAFAPPAEAAVVVTAGDTAIVNFDLTGLTPPPPYPTVEFRLNATDFDPGDNYLLRFFGDPDATGSVVPIDYAPPTGVISFVSVPFISDGIFSVRLTISAGEFSIEPDARGDLGPDDDPTAWSNGVVTRAPIPAPASLPLLGLGLACLAVALRRRQAR